MKQKVIPIIKDCSTSRTGDDGSSRRSAQKQRSSSNYNESNDLSSQSSLNYNPVNKMRKVKSGGSFNTGFYDDAITEEEHKLLFFHLFS